MRLPAHGPTAGTRLSGSASGTCGPVRVPLGLPPWLHRLRLRLPGLVRQLRRYYGEVRLLQTVRHRLRLLAFPMRTTRLYCRRWPVWRSPGSRTRSVRTCQGLRPRRVKWTLAQARPPVLPSAYSSTSALGTEYAFRGSMAGLYAPLSTLRCVPRGPQRMTRGQRDSLDLLLSGTFTLYSLPVIRRTLYIYTVVTWTERHAVLNPKTASKRLRQPLSEDVRQTVRAAQ
ncbi:hypothetical protein CBM2634_U350002 [Cupriavidus taiwanensis]|uniref:Uncharacterized protein n=1 Tax=Cupriavidus taiwanensis TaxID=164546 RepID=A0A375JFN7_9BURK|nr:hypothetical protein CBM2634_U350002 [Cupriavidus taiwanensis]